MLRKSIVLGVFAWLGLLGYVSTCSAALVATVTFNDLNPQVLFNTGSSPDAGPPFTTGDLPDGGFDIINNTGVTWTDFHITLRPTANSFGTYAFIDFAAGGYDGTAYEGPGTYSISANSATPSSLAGTLDIVGLNIASGSTLSFTLDIDHFEFFGTLDVVGNPTTDGRPPPTGGGEVPEPTTFAIFGLGALGLAIARMRARRRVVPTM